MLFYKYEGGMTEKALYEWIRINVLQIIIAFLHKMGHERFAGILWTMGK